MDPKLGQVVDHDRDCVPGMVAVIRVMEPKLMPEDRLNRIL